MGGEVLAMAGGLTMFRADREMSAAAEMADKARAERDTECLRLLTLAPRRKCLIIHDCRLRKCGASTPGFGARQTGHSASMKGGW